MFFVNESVLEELVWFSTR